MAKHGHHFGPEAVMAVIIDKSKDAKHYFEEGKKFEAIKCLKDVHSMVEDLIEITEQ